MRYFDVDQNSLEWFDMRAGKVTTSQIGKIMANYGKAFGNPAKDYATKIALEQIKGERIETDSYSNAYMERGHELEPIARQLYEIKREEEFVTVSNGGFCESEEFDFLGCSPDGLIFEENGGIEIKSVIYNTHFATLKRKSYPSAYKWQIISNLWICELDYLDFISYCPEYPKEKELFIYRVNKEDCKEEIEMIKTRLKEFEKEVEEQKKIIMA